MLFQLGNYKFEGLKLPLNWGMNFATNYAQIPIIGGKPVVQKLGEKLVEHDLSILFSDEFCNPKQELDALQAYRRNGSVLQLTGGDGTNYGKYVITDLSAINERANDSTGYISAISCSIKLLEYNSATVEDTQKGEALSSNKLTPMAPRLPGLSKPALIQKDLSDGKSKAKGIKKLSESAVKNYNKIMDMCTEAQTVFDNANSRIKKAEKIYQRTAALQYSIQDVKGALASIRSAANLKSVPDLLSANNDLEIAMYQLNGANAPLAAFVASREAGQ